jgi:pimeloyl-ACP methyl ester carboxylesterase
MTRFITLFFALAFGLPAFAAPDYGRERKWAEEILPSVLTGDPVYLDQADGHQYLTLYAPGDIGKTAVVLAHGIGVHPDWGLIGALRQKLPDAGHATLSVQMPVLKADAKGDDYVPTFDLAAQRLKQSVAWLKARGYTRIAMVSHSLGCRMTYRYLSGTPDADVVAWVAISTPGTEDYATLKQTVLDLYGDNDLAHVLMNAPARAKGLRQPGSMQRRIAGADHFFDGKDAALFDVVRGFLEARP